MGSPTKGHHAMTERPAHDSSLALIEQLIAQTPLLGSDAEEAFDLDVEDVDRRGLSSGEVRIFAAAKQIRTILDTIPWVDREWKKRISSALFDASAIVQQEAES